MRLLIHVGLSALLVIAPALCCCTVRLMAAQLGASPTASHTCPACPQSESTLPSRHPTTQDRSSGCCSTHGKSIRDTQTQEHKKQPVSPERCDVCFAKADAIPPEGPPTAPDHEPAGKLVPITMLGLAALPPEHLGLVGGLDPSGRAGVDARSDSLFVRHVLRC